MGLLDLRPGETIKCRSYEHQHQMLKELEALGINADYLYVKDGKEGMWVIIEPNYN